MGTARQRISNVHGVLPSRVQSQDDSKKKQESNSLLDIPGMGGAPVKDTLSELQYAATRAAKASNSSDSGSDSDSSSESDEKKRKKKRKKKHKSKRSDSDDGPKKKKR